MGKLLSSFVLAFVVVGGLAIGNDGHVTALVGEEDDKSDKSSLYVYSDKEIRNVEVQVEEEGPWLALTAYAEQDASFPYGIFLPAVSEGQEILVRGILPGRILFMDRLIFKAGKQGIEVDVAGISEEKAPLSHREMLYGAPDLHPQELAQCRVNHMAKHGLSGHLGGGRVVTSMGVLFEGWGMGGSSQPMTCVGAGAPFADATAKTSGGMTHRIRFYQGGTWSPGGGGGRALRRR